MQEEKTRDPNFEKSLKKFLDEEDSAEEVFFLWRRGGQMGYETFFRGDVTHIIGKLEYVIFNMKMNLYTSQMQARRPTILTPNFPKGN